MTPEERGGPLQHVRFVSCVYVQRLRKDRRQGNEQRGTTLVSVVEQERRR